MNKFLLILVLVFAISCFGSDQTMESSSTNSITEEFKRVVESMKKEMKLDPREIVFDVSLKEDSEKLVLEGKISDKNVMEKFLSLVESKIPSAEVRIELLPSMSFGTKIYGIVAVPVLNLGEAPWRDVGKYVVTQARMGEILRLLETKDGWYLVQMEDRYLGWVDGKKIWICDEKQLKQYVSNEFALVVAKMTPALVSPDGDAAFDKNLVQGTVLPVLDRQDDWSKLLIPGGLEVYVKSKDLRFFPSREDVFSEKRDAQYIIEIAKQYLGLPYLWGGTTAYGFDCSGFTQFCFKMAGYFLRRDADMQFEQGIAVTERKYLKPGDLVFFQTYKPGPSHIGIYIGNMKYIHSGNSGVAINSFDPSAPDYSQTLDLKYIGARRILP